MESFQPAFAARGTWLALSHRCGTKSLSIGGKSGLNDGGISPPSTHIAIDGILRVPFDPVTAPPAKAAWRAGLQQQIQDYG
eukprot:CAMPEP_0178466284 /NCGR_PEP_ID=MMETSP0689_2-20121128/51825_1 /TAXON_ID=160604 /ORGANISM="Amphidinium massartii, Strain CS-259" /LENGTH=80 /DNA_ID=CAMNT_0020093305 /DNA_START=166 /DNA_END=404 /DNA_ORIENTATION=-